MPQSPIIAAIAKTLAGLPALVKVDSSGNLQVAVESSSVVVTKQSGLGYVTVAASTTQALGTGAIGDVLQRLIIVPGTSAAGIVQIKDGTGTAITVFAGGGTTALQDLKPLEIELGAASAAGGWSVITNANVTAIAVGQFTA